MKKIYIFLAILLFGSSLLFSEVYVGGAIQGDQTWYKDDGPYVVISNIVIRGYAQVISDEIHYFNSSLTIEPGTIVKFNLGTNISEVKDTYYTGWLIAHGTSANPIYFTSIRDDTELPPKNWTVQ